MPDEKKDMADLQDKVQDLTDKVARMAKNAEMSASEKLSPETRKGYEEMKVKLDETGEVIRKKLEDAKSSAKQYGEQAQQYAKEKPWHVAAMAATAGLVLGLLARRKK